MWPSGTKRRPGNSLIVATAMGSALKLKSSKVARKTPKKASKRARREFQRVQYKTCKVMLKQMEIKMEYSKIEWTDHTFNPWIGCQQVSPGCDHCYAETQNAFRKWNGGTWGPHASRKRTSEESWKNPIKWNGEARAFKREHGRRPRVFCASLADVFDNQAPSEWRQDLFELIRECRRLDWLLLTKRPQNTVDCCHQIGATDIVTCGLA
jgi:hypothetical protein